MILLTGAKGFIGKNLKDYIVAKDETLLVCTEREVKSRNDNSLKASLLEYGIGNVNAQILSQIKVCIHAGSYVKYGSNESDDLSSALESLFFTQNLINLHMPNLKKFIFLSSMDVYDKSQESIREDSKTHASNIYQAVKLLCEQMIQDVFKESNAAIDILRVGHVFGPGDGKYRKALQNMVNAVKAEKPFSLHTSMDQALNLVYVGDLVRYIFSISQQTEGNGIINLVSSQRSTIADLIALIEKLSSSKLVINKSSSIKSSQFDYPFDNSKLRSTGLFYETPLEDALRQSYFSK